MDGTIENYALTVGRIARFAGFRNSTQLSNSGAPDVGLLAG
jgi:hypothetical protein